MRLKNAMPTLRRRNEEVERRPGTPFDVEARLAALDLLPADEAGNRIAVMARFVEKAKARMKQRRTESRRT